jgi:hypothetical protein
VALLEVGTGQPYSTVQAAINDIANSGHVRLNPGGVGNVYAEKLTVSNKRVRLTGSGVTAAGPRILVQSPDAVAALTVSGTGGVWVENLGFRTTLAAATFIVELNVAEDWISRCVIDGEDKGSKGIQMQFGDNCLIMRCTEGMNASCPGQNLMFHFTCVKCATKGLVANASLGEFVGCLTAGCNNAGLNNALAQYSQNCFSDDLTAALLPGSYQIALADMAFMDYAGNDFRLLPATLAFVEGIPMVPYDLLGFRRAREQFLRPRVVGGCFTSLPEPPAFLSGGSQIRSL